MPGGHAQRLGETPPPGRQETAGREPGLDQDFADEANNISGRPGVGGSRNLPEREQRGSLRPDLPRAGSRQARQRAGWPRMTGTQASPPRRGKTQGGGGAASQSRGSNLRGVGWGGWARLRSPASGGQQPGGGGPRGGSGPACPVWVSPVRRHRGADRYRNYL